MTKNGTTVTKNGKADTKAITYLNLLYSPIVNFTSKKDKTKPISMQAKRSTI